MSDLPSPAEPTSPTSRGTSDYEHRSLTSHSPQTRAPPSTVRSVLLIITCTLAMIHSTYNTSSVAIALPSIGADLHIPEARLQWLVSAYTLSAGCLLVFFGRLADLYGRRHIFMLGAISLAVFSVGLAFGNDEIVHDLLRGLQGAGGAATIPAAIGILAHSFPPPSKWRSIAFATFAAGAPVGAGLGIILGGVLTEYTKRTWRSTFYLSAGIAVFYLVLGGVSIEEDSPSTEIDQRLDWLGALLVTSGLVLVVFALSDGGIVGWNTPYIIALLCLGIACLALFVAWECYLERRLDNPDASRSSWTPPPLMKVSIWGRAKSRFAVIMAFSFFSVGGYVTWIFWVQLYLQKYVQLTPIHTVIRMLPLFVGGVILNIIITFVLDKLSLVLAIVSGALLAGIASLLFAFDHSSYSYWALEFPAIVLGVLGTDLVFASGTLFVAAIVHPHEQSVGGALFQTMAQIGTSFCLTITTIVFQRVAAKEAPHSNGPSVDSQSAAQLSGYHAAQWTTFGFSMLVTVLGACFLRGFGGVGRDECNDESEKEP